MRLVDVPLVSRPARWRIYPSEAYNFWETYTPGFSRSCRDLLAEDVTPVARASVRRALARIGSPRRRRILAKLVGWPRIGYLKEIFPDARFIHVYRDGRAMANSLLNMPWFLGRRGPTQWRFGELTPEQRERWENSGRSFVVLAALGWEILMSAFEAATRRLEPADLLEIRYETMCEQPLETFRAAAEFAGLRWTRAFESHVRRVKLRSGNDKWRTELTARQQHLLNACLEGTLRRWGYLPRRVRANAGGP
jgi:hypothetical protein